MNEQNREQPDVAAIAAGLTKRSLRAMRQRWSKDLERLTIAHGPLNWEADEPGVETIRNLATAIAQIEMLIGCAHLQEANNGK